ncbi:hypothetical protein RJT34_09182 [Clitoria ternatea]|uniref:LOB domain-containing protein n=1 Tax=Clitoria ternatea TaxID=43366 RepID=A0AAN9K8K2_CLITE
MQVKAMKGGYEPRSSSSCAACKLLKRRCIPNCIFAPYFRSDECKKFAKVHKVFGASNVSKILVEVPEEQREDTVNSLAYEAEARLRDPVYGCIGAIALLQRKMVELQHDLAIAKDRLARCHAANAVFSTPPIPDILPPFPDFSTTSTTSTDFTDILCHTYSSQLFTSVDDFNQIPYIF